MKRSGGEIKGFQMKLQNYIFCFIKNKLKIYT